MKRGKTAMKRNGDATSRQVTFSKRRNGLLKKAFELSVLCDVEVGLVVFSRRGRLCDFSNTSMQKMFDRFLLHTKFISNDSTNGHDDQKWKHDAASMSRYFELLEAHKQKLLGESLESCSLEELYELEGQLELSVSKIRGSKYKLLLEQISQLGEEIQEKTVLEENDQLQEKCKEHIQLPLVAPKEIVQTDDTTQQMDGQENHRTKAEPKCISKLFDKSD